MLIGFVQPARATDAFPGTDDHSTTTATAWWWYYGQTAQQVGDLAAQHNARLTQIRVEDPSVPTFAVTMVANTGDYASSWWWYYGQTADQVGALLNQHDARLISIDPYWTSAGLRFAVVMVPNTRTTFFNILVGGPLSASDPWGQVVTQEAASLGKSAIVPRFLAQLNVRWKAGSYTICLTNDGTCVPYKLDISLTGWMSIPFMQHGQVAARTFEFGDFANDLPVPCSNCTAAQNAGNLLQGVGAEAARSTIRQALMTWN